MGCFLCFCFFDGSGEIVVESCILIIRNLRSESKSANTHILIKRSRKITAHFYNMHVSTPMVTSSVKRGCNKTPMPEGFWIPYCSTDSQQFCIKLKMLSNRPCFKSNVPNPKSKVNPAPLPKNPNVVGATSVRKVGFGEENVIKTEATRPTWFWTSSRSWTVSMPFRGTLSKEIVTERKINQSLNNVHRVWIYVFLRLTWVMNLYEFRWIPT